MTAFAYEGRPLSDPRQLLLARAALLDGDQAIRAWRSWSASGRSIGHLDDGSYRLLPLVFRSLSAAGVDDERLATLRGVFRRTWYSNQRLLHVAARAVDALAQSGIPTMLLKGGALVAQDPGLAGVRPMNDVDLLVPREHLGGALQRIEQLGWRLKGSCPLEALVDRVHSHAVRSPRGHELDLHWRPCELGDSDAELWRAASPVVLHGVATLVPSAGDQLALTCIHGLGWYPTPLRWIADAMLLIKGAGDKLDWAAVLERARVWNGARAVRETLGLLARELGAPVPDTVLRELQRIPFDPIDALMHRVKVARPRSGVAWAATRRVVRRLDGARRPGAAGALGRPRLSVTLADLRDDWGEPSVGAALIAVGRRSTQLPGHSAPSQCGAPVRAMERPSLRDRRSRRVIAEVPMRVTICASSPAPASGRLFQP